MTCGTISSSIEYVQLKIQKVRKIRNRTEKKNYIVEENRKRKEIDPNFTKLYNHNFKTLNES